MNESTLVPREDRKIFGAKDAIDYAEAESKRVSDLDWLARNFHEWPYEHQTHCYVMTECEARKNVSACATSPFFSKKTKDQWLTRRAELQNKPSWKDAPEWANWLAQDEDGEWWFFSAKPKVQSVSFDERGSGISADYAKKGETLGDWRDTLEKRPEQTIADVCGEATDENRHKKVFEPFVSVEDAATAKQPSPKGSGNPILGMVLADLTNRALEGKEKYGEPLLAHNGRNPLWDAYQEALDLAMYLRQAIEEQNKC